MKLSAPSMWGNITDRPARHVGVINSEVITMGCICPGDTILVISERKRFSDVDKYLESVQVLTPVAGWCNAAYFISDSLWLERIA